MKKRYHASNVYTLFFINRKMDSFFKSRINNIYMCLHFVFHNCDVCLRLFLIFHLYRKDSIQCLPYGTYTFKYMHSDAQNLVNSTFPYILIFFKLYNMNKITQYGVGYKYAFPGFLGITCYKQTNHMQTMTCMIYVFILLFKLPGGNNLSSNTTRRMFTKYTTVGRQQKF